jgi:Lysozyme like domain
VKLGATEIVTYAAKAGFEDGDLAVAVAIALAESSGDTAAVGDDGTSIGLWQIHYTVHPQFDPKQLVDPQYNANAAYKLFVRRKYSFDDWSTYKYNAYLHHLDAALTAVDQVADMSEDTDV